MTAAAGVAPAHTGLLGPDLEAAHRSGVQAASCGLRDAGLGALRLTGPGVVVLAEAAVTSATPFLRSPLLARISAVTRLHPSWGDENGCCPTCGGSAPCATSRALGW